MLDENQNQGVTPDAGDTSGQPTVIPYERFREVNEQKKAAEAARQAAEQLVESLKKEKQDADAKIADLQQFNKQTQGKAEAMKIATELGLPISALDQLRIDETASPEVIRQQLVNVQNAFANVNTSNKGPQVRPDMNKSQDVNLGTATISPEEFNKLSPQERQQFMKNAGLM